MMLLWGIQKRTSSCIALSDDIELCVWAVPLHGKGQYFEAREGRTSAFSQTSDRVTTLHTYTL